MENLLINDLVLHYSLTAPIITNWVINTQEPYFEIEDTLAGEIVLHTIRNIGMAKFSNSGSHQISIINYDKFITSIADTTFKTGRKRCDIIMNCSSNDYIVFGEIKDRGIIHNRKKNNVRDGAKNQLLSSIQTVLSVPVILTYSNAKSIRICCYFNKQSASPASISATRAFNRLVNIYPSGFKMESLDIEAHGYEFYEFTGGQTMDFF